jgi:orotidine-5'-phosphate decarboxylase
VGAQGGDIDAVKQFGPATEGQFAEVPGGGLLVNVSRGIASAALDTNDPAKAIEAAATHWAHRLQC